MTDSLALTEAPTVALADTSLSAAVITHLDDQLESARRMLAVVQEQGAAIRERSVAEVVRLAASLQSEMHRRELLEVERIQLLERAAGPLGLAADEITMELLAARMDPQAAELATARAQDLRAVLLIIQREHTTNRTLMQQELAFLDHLLRLAGSAGGYAGDPNQTTVRRRAPLLHRPVFDYEA